MKQITYIFFSVCMLILSDGTVVSAQVAPFHERTRCNEPSWNAKFGIYLKMYRPSLKLHADLLYDKMNGYSEKAQLGENLIQLFDAIDVLSGNLNMKTAADITSGAVKTSALSINLESNGISNIVANQLLEWADLAIKPTQANFVKYVVGNTAETAAGLYGTIGINSLIDEYRLVSSTNDVFFQYYRDCGDQEEVRDDLNISSNFKDAEKDTDFLAWAITQHTGKGHYSSRDRQQLQKDINRVLIGVNKTYRQLSTDEVASETPDLKPYGLDIYPYKIGPGMKTKIEFGVKNEGGSTASPSVAHLQLTQNPDEVTTSDLLLASVKVPTLNRRAFNKFEETVTLPSDLGAGKYYVWLILDVNSEAGQRPADEGNDKDQEELNILYLTPDLEPRNLNTTPNSASPGQEVKVAFDIENYADGAAKPSKVRLRLSTSRERVTVQDPELATIDISKISPDEERHVEKVINIPPGTREGQHYIWVIVDVTSVAGQFFEDEKNDKRYEFIKIEE